MNTEYKTMAILIGNSDNKLSQEEWASFIEEVRKDVVSCFSVIHFEGGSNYNSRWQNACFVGTFWIEQKTIEDKLNILRQKYKQDSIAIICNNTKLIK